MTWRAACSTQGPFLHGDLIGCHTLESRDAPARRWNSVPRAWERIKMRQVLRPFYSSSPHLRLLGLELPPPSPSYLLFLARPVFCVLRYSSFLLLFVFVFH